MSQMKVVPVEVPWMISRSQLEIQREIKRHCPFLQTRGRCLCFLSYFEQFVQYELDNLFNSFKGNRQMYA